LKTQIEQIAWAGELEGWLPGPPKIHLVANPAEARFWEPIFKDAGERSTSSRRCPRPSWWPAAPNVAPRTPPPIFCRRNLPRAIASNSWTASGCAASSAVLSLYIVGVLIYFGALYALKLKFDHVKDDLASISGSYTNALKDHDQLQILEGPPGA
jgi:hypothetical protein